MIKKYLLIPLIVFVTLCGGEETDVNVNNKTVESTVNSLTSNIIKDNIPKSEKITT